MTDAPQGPDWWVASDGKWYPPQSASPLPPPPTTDVPTTGTPSTGAPTDAAPPMPPPTPGTHVRPGVSGMQAAPRVAPGGWRPARRTVSRGLSGTLQGFLWASAAFSLFAALVAVAALSLFDDYWDLAPGTAAERRAFDDWVAADDAFGGIAALLLLIGIVVFVLMLVWMNTAHKTTQQLWAGERTWGSGWTIGGWFIPLANFVIPKLVVNEIERIAWAPRHGGVVGPDWRRTSTSAVGWVWWIALVAGAILNAVGGGLHDGENVPASDVRAGYGFYIAGFLAATLAGVCGALYVRRITKRLDGPGLDAQP